MNTKVWTALLALYLVWGSTYLAIRFAVETIPPFFHAALRFLISGAVLYIWRRAAGDPAPSMSNWKSTAIVGVALLLGGNGLVSWAEQRVPSGIAALMIATSPFWLVLFEALRTGGTKPSWKALLGLILGFVGVFILIGPAEITGTEYHFDTFGIILLLLAAFFWSLGSIYARGANLPKSTLLSTSMQMLMGGIGLLIVSLIRGELNGFNFGLATMRSWLALAYLITFGSLIGFASYGWLLQRAPVSLISTYAYVNPVIAVLLGNLLADEPLNTRILIAAGIIIGSVIFVNRAQQVKAESLRAVPIKTEHNRLERR